MLNIPQNAENENKEETILYSKDLFITACDFMLHAADAFGKNNDLNHFLEYVNNTLMRQTIADGGAILLIDDLANQIAVKAVAGIFPPPYKLPQDLPLRASRIETHFQFAKFAVGESIFGKIGANGIGELITNPLEDNRIFQNGNDDFLKCGSYIFIPLKNNGVSVGIIALARKFSSSPFTDYDFANAEILGLFASVALKNIYSFYEILEHAELNREIEIARTMRKNLQTKTLQVFNSFSIGHYFNEAESACSDYYEAVFSRKDRVAFVCLDVGGKDLVGLQMLITIRSLLHLIINTTQNATTILEWINRSITNKIPGNYFANLSVILFNPEANTIECANAGNIPIYVVSGKKKIQKLTINSSPLGKDKNQKYSLLEFALHKNDVVCMLTDGILNTINGEGNCYSEINLLSMIIDSKLSTAQEIANKARLHIRTLEGIIPHYDDQTLFVLKV